MKYCTKCKETKPLSEYWKNKTTVDGLQSWCKPCWYIVTSSKLEGEDRPKYLRMRRNGNLLRKYGITADEYDEKFAAQDGKCLICAQERTEKHLAVDHDHDTGKVRGILCENCNRGIGMFKHDPKLLDSAIKYLARYQ